MKPLHRGDSKRVLIQLLDSANVRETLAGASITLKVTSLNQATEYLSKALGSGITLAPDALSAEAAIDSGDLPNPGEFLVKSVISWTDQKLQFTASDILTVV